MPATKEINPVLKVNNDTGFGTTGILNGSRFMLELHKLSWHEEIHSS